MRFIVDKTCAARLLYRETYDLIGEHSMSGRNSKHRRRTSRELPTLGLVALMLTTAIWVGLVIAVTFSLLFPIFPDVISAALCGVALSFTARRIRRRIRDIWREEQSDKTDVITTCIAF